jgi:hypothetical protein
LSDEEKKEELRKQRIENLKPHRFKKGNKVAVGNKGGRPKSMIKAEADEIDLKKFRTFIDRRSDWTAIVNTLYYNAFEHENKNGTKGNISWAKLFLAYAIGQPPVKVETQHTNMVDMVRMMVEQNMPQQEEEVIDAEVRRVD